MEIKECNWTQLPNDFIDQGGIKVTGLSGACIYWCILRKTKGFHREGDTISYSQITKMTGLATETISNAIKRLIENGLIQAVKAEGKATKYMPIFTTPSEIEEDHFDNRKGTSSKFEDTKDIYKDISKENIAEDVSPSRETKRKKVIHSPEDQELYKATLESFRKAYKFPLTNLKKEGPAIYGIIEKARGLGDPVEVIPAILGEFRELKIHGDAFWKSQPFLPSVINAGGIWPRILEVVEKNKSSPREREENQEFIKNLFRRKA